MGFFIICAGVVLLQLSKSAKDVPDSAVFAGDLDQVRTIAEQEQPESEPKADAIRGAAAIVRRFSQTRQKAELAEAKRLHEEKQADLEPIGEDEQIEWDGLRRRRTTIGTNSVRSRGNTTPFPPFENPAHTYTTPYSPQIHPPLGMSRFPSDSDSDHDEEDRPTTASTMGFFGRAKSIMGGPGSRRSTHQSQVQSPMHPVPLTEISIPAYKGGPDDHDTAYYGHEPDGGDHRFGLPSQLRTEAEQRERHITIVDDINEHRTASRGSSLHPSVGPTPPPHSARRQFSFQNVFRKGQSQAPPLDDHLPQSRSPMIRKGLSSRRESHNSAAKGATEEERLGLVKGDTNSGRQPVLPEAYDDGEEEDDEDYNSYIEDKGRNMRGSPERGAKRDLTPPRRDLMREKDEEAGNLGEEDYYEAQRRKFQGGGGNGGTGRGRGLPPTPRDEDGRGGGTGAFI